MTDPNTTTSKLDPATNRLVLRGFVLMGGVNIKT